MTDGENKVVMKYKDAARGQDGNPTDLIVTSFMGCDGRRYRAAIIGSELYVNGAKMESNEDKPCEFIGKCIGNNERCSYKGRGLDGPVEDRCTFYNDHIEMAALCVKKDAQKK